ncbi:L-fucose operon activator [Yokenella regensburgei]|uniref:L-fucose operon activator n=1 Tax=Yokenella regensburgei TaxID=158877 RepID=UPI003F168D13
MKITRQQALLQLLNDHETLTTTALAGQLGVSLETIRRDLKTLQTEGKIIRRHGRARRLHNAQNDSGEPFYNRLKSHYADKADIARHALNWIVPGMTLALDASSTCFHLAKQLPDIPLTVFTNSVPVCQEMARRENIHLICSGGELDRRSRCYVNAVLPTMLKSLETDLFIFSCEGVDANGEMWDSTHSNARFKTLLLKRAHQSLLLIDKSKFYRAGEARIGNLSLVTQMVTDAKPDAASR